MSCKQQLGRENDSYANDDTTNIFLSELTGDSRTGVAAKERACRHQTSGTPVNEATLHKQQRRDPVDPQSENRLDTVHPVNITHSDQSQSRQDQDTDARSEIAAIDRDQKKKQGDR